MVSSLVGAALLMVVELALAQDKWSGDLEAYAWLPVIEIEAADGSKGKITRDDILSDLDVAGMFAARATYGRWSLASDFIFLNISS